MSNLFRVNNKDTRTTSPWTDFTYYSGISIVDFEQVNVRLEARLACCILIAKFTNFCQKSQKTFRFIAFGSVFIRNYSFLQPYWLTQSSKRIIGIFHPFMKYFHSKINWTLNCHFAMTKKCYESSVWWSFFGKINNDFCPLFFVIAVMGVNELPEVSTRNKFSCLVVLIWFSWRLKKISLISLVQRSTLS